MIVMTLARTGVNRVEQKRGNNTTVLIDLTGDTTGPDVTVDGYTGHGKDGHRFTGKLKIAHLYTGTSAPAATIGVDGDIYLQK